MNKLAQYRAAREHQFKPFSERYWALHKHRAEVEAQFLDSLPPHIRAAVNEQGFSALDQFDLDDTPQLRLIQKFFATVPIYEMIAEAKQR